MKVELAYLYVSWNLVLTSDTYLSFIWVFEILTLAQDYLMNLFKSQIHFACFIFFFLNERFVASIYQVKVGITNIVKNIENIIRDFIFPSLYFGNERFLKKSKKMKHSFFSPLHAGVLIFTKLWVVRANTQTKVVQVCFAKMSKNPQIYDIIQKATFAFWNFNLSQIRYWDGNSCKQLVKRLNLENKKTCPKT